MLRCRVITIEYLVNFTHVELFMLKYIECIWEEGTICNKQKNKKSYYNIIFIRV